MIPQLFSRHIRFSRTIQDRPSYSSTFQICARPKAAKTQKSLQLVAAVFVQASMSKIQGLFKDFKNISYIFQGLNVNENTDLSVKSLLQKCFTEIMETLVLEN